MIGGARVPERYEKEWALEKDELTGREVRRLTGFPARSMHLYFTENAFLKGQNAIVFLSDRDTPGTENLFRLDLASGDITRLTAYPAGTRISGQTKTPDGSRMLYTRDNEITLLEDGRARGIFSVPEGFRPARLSLTCDGQAALVQLNEYQPPMGVNYANFTLRMVRIKRCIIMEVPLSGASARVLVRDTAEGGHLQASPTDADIFMFCHEGPWHLVNQRVFLGSRKTGEIWPCFRQDEDDCVGHEFFTRSGRVFLDNRGKGHDGTITSSRAQALARAPEDGEANPFIAFAGADGELQERVPMPYYLNHYHAGADEHVLVGDATDDILRVDIAEGSARLQTLCRHGTSWHGQHTHPHPTVDWTNSRVLFASDKSGETQLYLTSIDL